MPPASFSRRWVPAATAALSVLILTGVRAQTGPPAAAAPARKPAGLVLGQVIDAATNRPIGDATVTLTVTPPSPPAGPFPQARRALTDDQGRFLFRDLARATYLFAAAAPGYLDGGYGQRVPGAATQPFALDEDQRVGDVVIRLSKEATVSGTITDDTGSPVVGVSVWLTRRTPTAGPYSGPFPNAQATAQTDDRGTYQIRGIVPGEYVVSVPSRTIAAPVSLLEPPAPVAESLRSSGSMAVSMGMSAMSPGVRLGDFVMQTSNQGAWGGSNALVSRLPYVLLADGRISGYPTTFHPSATVASEAIAFPLASGEERTGVDVQLRPVKMVRVSGVVSGPGGPEQNLAVHLFPPYAANLPLERTHEAASTVTDQNGAFVFMAVAPGPYVLKGWRLPQILSIGRDALPPDATMWGELAVNVGDAATTGIALTLRPGVTISGRIEFDGTAAVPPGLQLQPFISRLFEPSWSLALGNMLASRVTATYEFSLQGQPPGRYFLNAANALAPSAWNLESAVAGERDLLLSPLALESTNVSGLVMRFSDRRTELAGSVQDANGRLDASAVVLVFPADYRGWIQEGLSPFVSRMAPASQRGTYSVKGLRPGDYLAVAVTDDVAARWPQRATIESLVPSATRVTLTRGDVTSQALRIRR